MDNYATHLEPSLGVPLQHCSLAALGRAVGALCGDGERVEGIVDVGRVEACNGVVQTWPRRRLGGRLLAPASPLFAALFCGALAPTFREGGLLCGQLLLTLGLFARLLCLLLGLGLGALFALALFASRVVPRGRFACLGRGRCFSRLLICVGRLFCTA